MSNMVLPLRRRRKRQPQVPVGVDPAFNPAYAWIGSQPLREIIKGLPVTGFNDGAGSTFEIGAAGRNAFLWTTGTPSRIRISGAVSPGNEFIAVVNYQNFVDNNAAVFMAGKTFWNQSNGFMFESKTNTDTLEINGGDASTFPTISVPNVGKADGKIHTLVGGCKGTKARVAFDGRYIGEVTIAVAGTWPNGLAVGNYAGVANSATPGRKIYCAAVLGKGDIVSLSASPWQIFPTIPRRIFVPVSAGGSALAAAGSATASGSAGLSVAIPLSAVGFAVSDGTANAVATVTIAAAGFAQAAGSAGLSAALLLQGAGAAQAAGNAALAAQLNALASGAAQASGSANLSGGAPGALSASDGAVASGTAVLSVTVGLTASGSGVASGMASLSGGAAGQVAAVGGAQAGGSGVLRATVSVTAAGFVQAMGAGYLTLSLPFSGFAPLKMAAAHQRLNHLSISARRLSQLRSEVSHG